MIPALIIGRQHSKGFPGKNNHKINGIPLMAYPIQAANDSKCVNEVFFSTDSSQMKFIAEGWGATVIDRPAELATDEALSDDVWVHGYNWIIGDNVSINILGEDIVLDIEFILLMFANAPCITGWMIDEMIEKLRGAPLTDSICTVSLYNMYNPVRMRKFNSDIIYSNVKETKHEIIETDKEVLVNLDYDVNGDIIKTKSNYLVPYAPETLEGSSCDRDSGEDSYIYDCSCSIVRPHCIENIEEGQLPQRWLGKNILGYKQTIPAVDIDYEWQLGQLQYWLDRNWVIV